MPPSRPSAPERGEQADAGHRRRHHERQLDGVIARLRPGKRRVRERSTRPGCPPASVIAERDAVRDRGDLQRVHDDVRHRAGETARPRGIAHEERDDRQHQERRAPARRQREDDRERPAAAGHLGLPCLPDLGLPALGFGNLNPAWAMISLPRGLLPSDERVRGGLVGAGRDDGDLVADLGLREGRDGDRLELGRGARASVTYTKPASASPSTTLPTTPFTSDSWLTTLASALERPRLRSTVRV